MADIQSARFGRYLQSLFNLKQRVTLGEVMPDCLPTVEVDKPRPEDELFLGNDLCFGQAAQTGGAASFAQVGCGFITTPSAQRPGVVMVIEEVTVSSGTAQSISLSLGSMSALASVSGAVSKLDTRRYLQAPTGVVRDDNDIAAIPTGFFRSAIPVNTALRIPGPFVLVQVPGSFEAAGLIVTSHTALAPIIVSFRWRERMIRADELIV